MPRTKLSKNQKRNREVANEEALASRLRDFDAVVDQYLCNFELEYQQDAEDISNEISMLMRRLPKNFLKMKLGTLADLNIKTIEEFNQLNAERSNSAMLSASISQSARKKSKDDEGYLTEDNTRISNSTQSSLPRKGRTPLMGPLSSARAKSRRRSQSACGYLSIIKQASAVEHSSRSKMRTPLNNRTKAASADRADPVTPKIAPNTPLSLLRYPKAGETVISLSGSPVVAQGIQDPIANVNIPVRNGVISLRPTKMQSIDPDILTGIDAETLNQIKQLQSNLNIIMRYADKALT